MAYTAFPITLDDFTNPSASQTLFAAGHNDMHCNAIESIEALEAKVGVDSSAVATSLDYILKNSSSSNPGHKHTLANGASDVTASLAEINKLDGLATTKTELGYVAGVTSAIQTQMDAKVTNPMSAAGDVIYGGASGTPTRLAKGSDGQGLVLASGLPSWGAISTTLVSLSDTPANYTGAASKIVAVNSTPDAVEFYNLLVTNLVDKSAGETITGLWDFSTAIPTLPASDPTTDNQAVRKAYIDFSAGDLLFSSADTERSNGGSSPTKIKEIQTYRAGTIRVKFEAKSAGGTGNARIYLNGAAEGTLRSLPNDDTYVLFSEDITVSVGDLIQLYIWVDTGGTAYGKDFRIYIAKADYTVVNTD